MTVWVRLEYLTHLYYSEGLSFRPTTKVSQRGGRMTFPLLNLNDIYTY